MALHGSLKIGLVSCMWCGMALMHHGVLAAVDATFMGTPPDSATGSEAPVYDSEYAAELRLHGTFGNTPESDARPGEYFFTLGANAFRKQEYTFAIQMYQAAASWAFKPAEYNLGVMYARGQGVAVDLPRAMAWMALAAERNDPQRYVDSREAVYAALTEEQFEQANEIWRGLKPTYGDAVALKRAKMRWAEVRAHMTGSRVGAVSNLQVGIPGDNLVGPATPKLPAPVAAAAKIAPKNAGSASDLTGGNSVDGSVAYRQFRESDNPYDPKFETSALGKATVGPLKQIPASAPDETTTDKPDPEKKDQQR
jgi:TPR repeat protein